MSRIFNTIRSMVADGIVAQGAKSFAAMLLF